MIYNNQVLNTYCVVPILEHLSDVECFRTFCTGKGVTFTPKLVRGYAFSVICSVDHLIKQVASLPNYLGLEYDRLIYRADFVGVPYYNWPYQSITGIVARNLVELYRPLLGVNHWDEFVTIASKISAYITKPLRDALSIGLKQDTEKDRLFVETSLKYAATSFTTDVLLDFTDVRLTYEKVYKKGKHSWESDEEEIPIVIDKQDFFLGYKLAIEYLLDCFTEHDYMKFKGVPKLISSRDWAQFNRFANIRAEGIFPQILQLEDSKYLDTIFKGKSLKKSLSPLYEETLFVEKIKSSNERLDQLFMWYDVSILDVGNNLLGFITLLRGYDSLKPRNIQIIKMAHPQEDGLGNNYSFAILLESFGFAADMCYWLLFYNFATDYSGTGGSYYKVVLQNLKRLGKRVHVTDISIHKKDLLTYLESYRIKKLTTRCQELLKMSEKLKGGLFELLIAHLMSRMGFKTCVRYRNTAFLRNMEIDVVAVHNFKNGKIKIVIAEAFGSFPDNDIPRKTKEMTEKLSILRSKSLEILEDAGFVTLKQPIDSSIEGWLFTYDTKNIRRLENGVRVLDIRKIKGLCKKYSVNFSEFSEFLKKQDIDFSVFNH